MAYFTRREIEAFFGAFSRRLDRAGAPAPLELADEMEEYLRVLNVAHDLPPLEALAAVEELLDEAPDDDAVSWVGAATLEPVVDLHYEALGSALEDALRRNPKLRDAFDGVITTRMPEDLRAHLDGIGR
jgi:hypothetical protein